MVTFYCMISLLRHDSFSAPVSPLVVICSITSQRPQRYYFSRAIHLKLIGLTASKSWALCPHAILYYTSLKMPLMLYHQHDLTFLIILTLSYAALIIIFKKTFHSNSHSNIRNLIPSHLLLL